LPPETFNLLRISIPFLECRIFIFFKKYWSTLFIFDMYSLLLNIMKMKHPLFAFVLHFFLFSGAQIKQGVITRVLVITLAVIDSCV